MKNNQDEYNSYTSLFVYFLLLLSISAITIITVITSGTTPLFSWFQELNIFSLNHQQQVFLQNAFAQQIEQFTISKLQELEKTDQVKLKTQSPLIPLADISNIKTTSKITSDNNVTNKVSELLSDTNFTETKGPDSKLRLAMSKIAIDIPLQKAYENGHEIFLVTFDASDNILAQQLTDYNREFPIHYTKVLSQTPESALNEAYIFKNGVKGKGHLGFQPTIITTKPGDKNYSPLKHVNFVEWNNSSAVTTTELKSEEEIVAAQQAGKLKINNTSPDLVINAPAIKWQGDSLKIRADKIITDETPFVGGQVTNIDTDNMIVTMVTMRAFGPDGKTVYWLVTDATPMTDDIIKGGIVYSPANELLASTPVAVDFYQFINGIRNGGPQGFQPPISPVNLEDSNYSPMWRVLFVSWKDPQKAHLLQTMYDLNQMMKKGLIEIIPVLKGKHIVNCPFFDQSTVLKFRHIYN
ncbi:MAG TPA: hypothetical protein VJ767_04900 [Nitrososphaeraceae archaeon]|nr:hypothetical protein [Nitrososphaeraceae archaeon]